MNNPVVLDPQELAAAQHLIALGIAEDLGGAGDISSRAVIAIEACATARIVAREDGVVAGLPVARMVCERVDPTITLTASVADGTRVGRAQTVGRIAGLVRSLLAAERLMLNFMGRISGIATLTRQYVDAVAGLPCAILDTRKTTPGWRRLERYAVRAGGGQNHRMGLYDAVLLKDNHRIAWRQMHPSESLAALVRVARRQVPPGSIVEIEVETIAELAEALDGDPDIVLLDNMSPGQLLEAAALRKQRGARAKLEASGGVSLATVRAIAETGVERISVGALTHSARVLDLALDFDV
jgi:nicotinate-nucleotide pyrophosphorylase (carboxylating)